MVALRVIAARPYLSREDCLNRVHGMGESRLVRLEQAGIVFPPGCEHTNNATSSSALLR